MFRVAKRYISSNKRNGYSYLKHKFDYDIDKIIPDADLKSSSVLSFYDMKLSDEVHKLLNQHGYKTNPHQRHMHTYMTAYNYQPQVYPPPKNKWYNYNMKYHTCLIIKSVEDSTPYVGLIKLIQSNTTYFHIHPEAVLLFDDTASWNIAHPYTYGNWHARLVCVEIETYESYKFSNVP